MTILQVRLYDTKMAANHYWARKALILGELKALAIEQAYCRILFLCTREGSHTHIWLFVYKQSRNRNKVSY